MNELRGAIHNAFASIAEFARALGWDRAKVSRFVNHKQRPTADEMELMAKTLRITNAKDFVRIFFPTLFN